MVIKTRQKNFELEVSNRKKDESIKGMKFEILEKQGIITMLE